MSRSPWTDEPVPRHRDLVLANSEKPAELDDRRADPAIRVEQQIVELADLVALCAIDILADELLDILRDREGSGGRRDGSRTGAGAVVPGAAVVPTLTSGLLGVWFTVTFGFSAGSTLTSG